MIGQIVSGSFSTVVVRVRKDARIELGQLLVAEGDKNYLLQVYDLQYGSQLSQQNLEMMAGLSMEYKSEVDIIDPHLRTYQMAYLKPLLILDTNPRTCKVLPTTFSSVRYVTDTDLKFLLKPRDAVKMGTLRNGDMHSSVEVYMPARDMFTHHILVAASTGKGKSNFMYTLLWGAQESSQVGFLILDPHDEYYGRANHGLKDHPAKKVTYYTLSTPPPGALRLQLNLRLLKPDHFMGTISLSDPQQQALYSYYRKYGSDWVRCLLLGMTVDGHFRDETLQVVQRKLSSILNIDVNDNELLCRNIFTENTGDNTVSDVCNEIERGATVIIDTSQFSGATELLVGSILSEELLRRYKRYMREGVIDTKAAVSIVIEEAPRVLGKRVLEKGSNVYETIAREGRKFCVGLIAITQIPSEIPKHLLANMNTKIILGIEMESERSAVVQCSAQDLSKDMNTIASLDKGEAIVTSTFTRFAIPLKIPLFKSLVTVKTVSLPGFN